MVVKESCWVTCLGYNLSVGNREEPSRGSFLKPVPLITLPSPALMEVFLSELNSSTK
jgi:hypothetical protein